MTLILDSNFICHQAAHALRKLTTADDVPSGVVFGFLSRMLTLAQRFHTKSIYFTWDSRFSYRKRRFPFYKTRKATEDPEELAWRRATFKQMKLIRKDILPTLGFRNVFMQGGVEADDLMSVLVNNTLASMVIVTADADIYQLLYPHVRIYNPTTKKTMTAKRLMEAKGVKPGQWAHVKALAGCSSDTVPGVPGVGEKTAIRYLCGKLPPKYKTYQQIISKKGQSIYARNLLLVRLPLPVTSPIIIEPDELSMGGLEEVCKRYKLPSLWRRKDEWQSTFLEDK